MYFIEIWEVYGNIERICGVITMSNWMLLYAKYAMTSLKIWMHMFFEFEKMSNICASGDTSYKR